MLKKYVIGIDVGGTNTRIGKISPKGKVLESQMLKTSQYKDATTFLGDMIQVIKKPFVNMIILLVCPKVLRYQKKLKRFMEYQVLYLKIADIPWHLFWKYIHFV